MESEPEGEKAEDLASLETLDDDEGGRNRITRWCRMVDPQPAFHYLAEDDDGELASGGLNHLVAQNDPDASNDMSYEAVCAIAWKLASEQAGNDRQGRGHGIVGKEADEWPSSKRDGGAKKGGKKGFQAHQTRLARRQGQGRHWGQRKKAKARAGARVRPDTATIAESKGMSG